MIVFDGFPKESEYAHCTPYTGSLCFPWSLLSLVRAPIDSWTVHSRRSSVLAPLLGLIPGTDAKTFSGGSLVNRVCCQ